MADNSWDSYTADAPRGRIGGKLLAALAGIIIVVTVLATGLGVAAKKNRGSAWPLVLNVAGRLQTDDQARELFRRNPALTNTYSTEEAFLDRVHEFRDGLKFPETAPGEGPNAFRVFPSPFDLRIRAKGAGECWMEVEVEFGGPFRPATVGEGISRLNLYKDLPGLRRQTQQAAERRSAQSWERFVKVARTLAKESGPADLRPGSPKLRTVPTDEASFTALARQRRSALLGVPEDPAAHGPHRIRSHHGPFSRTVEIEATLPDGGKLKALWKSEILVAVELR